MAKQMDCLDKATSQQMVFLVKIHSRIHNRIQECSEQGANKTKIGLMAFLVELSSQLEQASSETNNNRHNKLTLSGLPQQLMLLRLVPLNSSNRLERLVLLE